MSSMYNFIRNTKIWIFQCSITGLDTSLKFKISIKFSFETVKTIMLDDSLDKIMQILFVKFGYIKVLLFSILAHGLAYFHRKRENYPENVTLKAPK